MKDRSDDFAEWFSTDSKNFFGTGLTLAQFMTLGKAERFMSAWSEQCPAERQRRLHFVCAMSVELAKIEAVDRFATAIGAMAIEQVVQGDAKMLGYYARTFSWEDERPETRDRYAPLWAAFAKLCEECATTTPEDGREPGEEPS